MTSLLVSCSANLGWRTVAPFDTPWNAPDRHASQLEHGHKDFMPDNPRWDSYWTKRDGGKVRVVEFVGALERLLQSEGLLAKWRDTGSIGKVRTHMAPWRFCIVSIDPCIVILTPYPDDPQSQDTIHRLIATSRKDWLRSDYLDNPIEFGSWIPYSQNFLVLDLDQKAIVPISTEPSTTNSVITLFKCNLGLDRQVDKWIVTRMK